MEVSDTPEDWPADTQCILVDGVCVCPGGECTWPRQVPGLGVWTANVDPEAAHVEALRILAGSAVADPRFWPELVADALRAEMATRSGAVSSPKVAA